MTLYLCTLHNYAVASLYVQYGDAPNHVCTTSCMHRPWNLVASHTEALPATSTHNPGEFAVTLSMCQISELYHGISLDLCIGAENAKAGIPPANSQERKRAAITVLNKFVNLGLSVNSLRNIENLRPLQNLRYLDVSLNHLTSLAGLVNLVNLVDLNVSNNAIRSFKDIAKLPKLKTFVRMIHTD